MGQREQAALSTARERFQAGRFDEAAALYRRILDVDPDHLESILGFADARHALGDLAGAIPAYDRCLDLDPHCTVALWGQGCAQASLGDHAAAIDGFGRLVAIQPENGMARLNLGRSLYELGQVDAALHAFRSAVDHLPSNMQCMAMENLAVAIPGLASASNQEVLGTRQAWASRCAASRAMEDRPARQGRDAGTPVRLGYVSAFLDKRNWMKPVWGLLNRHDRDRFEIHLFSDRPESAIGPGLRRDPRDHFHDVTALNNSALADLIERLEIDLLVDLNGYSRPPRLALFGLRPAPVQVAWFNMFASSGMDGLDYLVGDEHVILPGEERCFSERVVRVPGSYLTFEVTYPVPDVSPPPCLEQGRILFGCLAPQYKITPEVVAAWSRIVSAVPSSKLLLKNTVLEKPAARESVLRRFAGHGVGADRLILEGPSEHYEFLGRYAAIDIALDTFPYNGGTTTMEALWQGVPVLTFDGDRWASRISASLLREAGLAQFVAPDLDSFVHEGITLGTDPATPARLRELREAMRERLRAASVCQVQAFTRSMERAYLAMLREG